VEQSELEKFDGVSTGKYTIGLGQTKMSFCDDREGQYSWSCHLFPGLFVSFSFIIYFCTLGLYPAATVPVWAAGWVLFVLIDEPKPCLVLSG
jgi:hypothetical protein